MLGYGAHVRITQMGTDLFEIEIKVMEGGKNRHFGGFFRNYKNPQGFKNLEGLTNNHFFKLALAAANLATGTRKGEQLT